MMSSNPISSLRGVLCSMSTSPIPAVFAGWNTGPALASEAGAYTVAFSEYSEALLLARARSERCEFMDDDIVRFQNEQSCHCRRSLFIA